MAAAAALLLSAAAATGCSRSSGGVGGLLVARIASALTASTSSESSWIRRSSRGGGALRSFAVDAATATPPSPSSSPAAPPPPPPSPRARLLRQRKAPVALTPAAIERVKSLLEKRHKEYLRLGIKRRGCNGLAYTLNYADAPSRLDEVVEVGFDEESGGGGEAAEVSNGSGSSSNGDGGGGAPSPSPSPSRTAKKTVKVLVDPGALMHVVGTTMDWVEDEVRASFVFTNPNQEGSCGCGESFTSAADVAARKNKK